MFDLEYRLGERLNEERLRLYFSIDYLSEITQIDSNTIYKYENGKLNPSDDFFEVLQKHGFDINYIFLSVKLENNNNYPISFLRKIAKELDLFPLKTGEELTETIIKDTINQYRAMWDFQLTVSR